MVEIMAAKVAREMSEYNATKSIPLSVQQIVAKEIENAAVQGEFKVCLDIFERDTCLKIASWLSRYGYRAYFDERGRLVVLWSNEGEME